LSPAAKKKTLKWLAVIAVAPAVILVLLIAAFVARSELAHDESTCPFEEVGRRDLGGGVIVIDEGRSCQEGVEEHRWVVHRGGATREIGRRRLMSDLYAEERYRWTATVDDGQVRIAIENDGTESARFREGEPGDR
jgi:hypothetical protein